MGITIRSSQMCVLQKDVDIITGCCRENMEKLKNFCSFSVNKTSIHALNTLSTQGKNLDITKMSQHETGAFAIRKQDVYYQSMYGRFNVNTPCGFPSLCVSCAGVVYRRHMADKDSPIVPD